LLCLIFLALALRLLKDNSSITMIYIIKILQITEISTFSASILDKAVFKRWFGEYVSSVRFENIRSEVVFKVWILNLFLGMMN